MSSWNRNPAAFQPKITPVVPTAEVFAKVVKLAAVSVLAALCTLLTRVFALLAVPAHVRFVAVAFLWSTSASSAVWALNTFWKWKKSRTYVAEQDKLMDSQRKLLGLPPTPPKPGTPADSNRKMAVGATRMAPAIAPQSTPLSPPLRYPRTPQTAGLPGEYGAAAVTPLSTSTSVSRPSPKTSGYPAAGTPATVATPKQLQQYLDNLSVASTGKAGVGASVSTPGFGMTAPATPGSGFMGTPGPATTPYAQDMFGAATDNMASPMQMPYMSTDAADGASSPAMPYGVQFPKYRPSWLPRAKAAQASAAHEVVEAATHEETEEFLWAIMRVRRAWLEIWTERLREWFASRVLQSLVSAVQTAHSTPNALLAKYNQSVKLPPLSSVFEASSTSSSVNVQSSSTLAGAAGNTQQDVEPLLRHTQQIAAAVGGQSLGSNPVQTQDGKQLAESLVRYEQLLLLLRGRWPAELLPPSPPGYIWARARQLAQSTCVMDYNWNGGGAWAGRPWTPDIITDSQLLLYLFAAFIDAPGWEFSSTWTSASTAASTGLSTMPGGLSAGGGPPLFLGAIRTARLPPQYSAVLAYRPERPGKGVDALLALSAGASGTAAGSASSVLTMPGSTTMFCFLAEGRLLALTGYNALFHAILAFLAYHKNKYNGAVGNHYLQDEALGLSSVIEPPKPGASATQPHSVFGWWFPPRGLKGRDKAE